jgi:hypothetical protein
MTQAPRDTATALRVSASLLLTLIGFACATLPRAQWKPSPAACNTAVLHAPSRGAAYCANPATNPFEQTVYDFSKVQRKLGARSSPIYSPRMAASGAKRTLAKSATNRRQSLAMEKHLSPGIGRCRNLECDAAARR